MKGKTVKHMGSPGRQQIFKFHTDGNGKLCCVHHQGETAEGRQEAALIQDDELVKIVLQYPGRYCMSDKIEIRPIKI